MDKFFVIRNGVDVVDTFTSETAARLHIAELISIASNTNTYQVAQVIATNRPTRLWNTP